MLRNVLGITSAVVVLTVLIFALGPELAALAAAGLLAAWMVIRFPVVGVFTLVLILPFNALVSQVLEGAAAGVYGALKDGLLALILINAIATRRVRLVPRPVTVLVSLLVLVPWMSALFTPSLEQALFGWRNDYEPLLLLIGVAAVLEQRHIRPLMLTIAFMAQLSATVSIVTWNRGLEWLFDIGRLPVVDQRDFPTSLFSQGSLTPRAFSPYVAPNELAAAMLISLAVIWCMPAVRGRSRLLLTILPVIALALAESRSGLLGGAVLFMILSARAIRGRSPLLANGFLLLAGFGVAFGALLFILDSLSNESDSSFGGHADSLQDSLREMILHPLGRGLGTVGPRALQFEGSYHVESFWLLLALESGIAVLILFLSLIGYLAVQGARSKTSTGYVITAALAATVVSQIVLPSLQEGPVSFLLWLVGGLALAALRCAESERSDDETVDSVRLLSARM